jgi:hypothetical protein
MVCLASLLVSLRVDVTYIFIACTRNNYFRFGILKQKIQESKYISDSKQYLYTCCNKRLSLISNASVLSPSLFVLDTPSLLLPRDDFSRHLVDHSLLLPHLRTSIHHLLMPTTLLPSNRFTTSAQIKSKRATRTAYS